MKGRKVSISKDFSIEVYVKGVFTRIFLRNAFFLSMKTKGADPLPKETDAPNFFIGRSDTIANNEKLSHKSRQACIRPGRPIRSTPIARTGMTFAIGAYHDLSSFRQNRKRL